MSNVIEWTPMAVMEVFEEAKHIKLLNDKKEDISKLEKEFEEDYGVTWQVFLEANSSCMSCTKAECDEDIDDFFEDDSTYEDFFDEE